MNDLTKEFLRKLGKILKGGMKEAIESWERSGSPEYTKKVIKDNIEWYGDDSPYLGKGGFGEAAFHLGRQWAGILVAANKAADEEAEKIFGVKLDRDKHTGTKPFIEDLSFHINLYTGHYEPYKDYEEYAKCWYKAYIEAVRRLIIEHEYPENARMGNVYNVLEHKWVAWEDVK
jgi:hypothetical protein